MSDFIIKGGYGLRNFGDDALMYYLVKSIEKKYPTATIALHCKEASYIVRWLDGISFARPYQIPRKAYLHGGGTLYYSFPRSPVVKHRSFLEKLVLSLRKPSHVFNRVMLGWRRQRFAKSSFKKVMLGIGFGPFHLKDARYENAIKDIQDADVICVRDKKSLDFASAFSKNVFHGTDICYAKGIVNQTVHNSSTEVETIGVVVRDWKYGTTEDDYETSLLDAVQLLRENGYQVKFIIFSDLRDKEWLQLLRRLGEDALVWNPDEDSVEGFMQKLSAFDLFISARFHGLVFSTLLNKPAISVALEQKLEAAVENAVCKVWLPIASRKEELLNLVQEYDREYEAAKADCSSLVEEKAKLYSKMLDFTAKGLQ